jgi:NADH-quinone oxidoreductase subunit L
MVIMGTIQAGKIWVAALALFVAVLTMFYLFRLFNMVFLGETKLAVPEKTPGMLFVVIVLAVLSLLGGIFIAFPTKMVSVAVSQIFSMGVLR